MRRRPAARLLTASLAFAGGLSLVIGGLGNVGRTTDKGGGGTLTLKANPTFEVQINAGDDIPDIRDQLVQQIDAHAGFKASVVSDPDDPDANSFRILRENDKEPNDLEISETDPNIDHVGISSEGSWLRAALLTATQVNADGSYRLMIDVSGAGDFDQTFDTTMAPNNTAAGLNASVLSALQAAGYMVDEGAGRFLITPPHGSLVLAIRTSSSDTGVVVSGVGVSGLPPENLIPTLSQAGVLVLVVLLAAAAVLLLRRRAAASP